MSLDLELRAALDRVHAYLANNAHTIESLELPVNSSSDGFQHAPLRSSDELRLVTIEQDLVDGLISCHLSRESIKSEYAAISYAWGEDDRVRMIYLDGKPFVVRFNCEMLLRALRSQDLRYQFWIDALCIDQTNVLERNGHAMQMQEIYHGAQTTLVYLGEHDSDSANILQSRTASSRSGTRSHTRSCQSFDSNLRRLDIESSDLCASIDTGLGNVHSSVYRRGRHDGTALKYTQEINAIFMGKFQTRPWFHRLWMVQEVLWPANVEFFLSSESCECFNTCDNFFPMESIFRIWIGFVRQGDHQDDVVGISSSSTDNARSVVKPEVPAVIKFIERRRTRSSTSHGKTGRMQLPLWQVFATLEATRDFQCTDPRDKIFAIGSSFAKPIPELLRPSYEKSVIQTYSDAMFFMINYMTSEAIMAAGTSQQRQTGDSHGILPSWVIDWREPRYTSEVDIQNWHAGYSEGHKQIVAHREDNVLIMRGLPVEVVQALAGEVPMIADTSELRRLRRLQEAGDQPASIYCLLINGDLGVERASFLAALCTEGTIQGTATPDPTQTRQDTDHLTTIAAQCNNRRLLHLSNGNLAIGPEGTQAGDCVCVFLGVETPMLIRPLDDHSWQLIGQCFVAGVMHGEAIERVDWETVQDPVPKSPLWDFRLV
ncbi:unnamed protein product [Zymoseptoria tritici ST99CH_1A5]|uniref:Heterokaryon incompatibility domain-containing protein n=1 Tax=Zymoseptoria tritici ST99CH_1A5 TaxID=1276529 RepID=A0A1Y6LFV9_ZYMTR|nr:unnamed protein product [Zymoseptoria tritici ST99CH_1A5]